MSTAFQPQAFQSNAFQVFEEGMSTMIPVFLTFPMSEVEKTIEAGQATTVRCKIGGASSASGIIELFDPSTLPEVQILDPLDVVFLEYTVMAFINTGVYGLTVSTTGAEQGLYVGRFRCSHDGVAAQSEDISLFTVT